MWMVKYDTERSFNMQPVKLAREIFLDNFCTRFHSKKEEKTIFKKPLVKFS